MGFPQPLWSLVQFLFGPPMARNSFAELLNELHIPEPIQQALLDEAYDIETFGLVALSLTGAGFSPRLSGSRDFDSSSILASSLMDTVPTSSSVRSL